MSKINKIQVENVVYDVEDSEIQSWARQTTKPTYDYSEITNTPDLTTKQDKITNDNKLSSDLVSGLSTVATSGSYNDLSNKPTIPDISNLQEKITSESKLSADLVDDSETTNKFVTASDITKWNNGGLKVEYAGDYPFVFSGKEPAIYIPSTTAGDKRFSYKLTSIGASTQLNVEPFVIYVFKKYDDIGTPSSNTYFASLIGANNVNGSDNGAINILDFYVNTSGQVLTSTYYTGNKIVSQWSQKFSGVKTFQNSPEISSANTSLTSNTQLTHKKYVDDNIGKFSTMPSASSTYLDKIVQFVGATDSTYTNGYFYKCVSDGALTPTYSWENINVQAGSSSASIDLESAYQSAVEPFIFAGKKKGIYYNPALNGDAFYFKKNSSDTLRTYTRGRILFIILQKDYDENANNDIFGCAYVMDTYTLATTNGALCYKAIRNSSGTITIDNNGNNLPGQFITTATQTFDGLKTFKTIPQQSTTTAPTQDKEFTNKKYVDDAITNAITTTLGGSY